MVVFQFVMEMTCVEVGKWVCWKCVRRPVEPRREMCNAKRRRFDIVKAPHECMSVWVVLRCGVSIWL